MLMIKLECASSSPSYSNNGISFWCIDLSSRKRIEIMLEAVLLNFKYMLYKSKKVGQYYVSELQVKLGLKLLVEVVETWAL